MTIGILSWNLRETNGEVSPECGWLLMNLYWYTNAHMRCWPGMKRLAKQCGMAAATLDKAMDWLVSHDAVIKVPYAQRQLEEKALYQSKTVYQLTGVINLSTGYLRYVEIDTPETAYSLAKLVHSLNISLAEILRREFSISKILAGENEGIISIQGITGIQGDTEGERAGAQNPPLAPSEEKTPPQRSAPKTPTPNAAPPPPHIVPKKRSYTPAERDQIVPGFQQAYEKVIGAAVNLSTGDEALAVQASRNGYTPADMERATRGKMKEKNGVIPVFRFVIQDMHQYPAQPTPAQKKVFVAEPQVQLSPEKLAQRLKDMAELRAKITGALQ